MNLDKMLSDDGTIAMSLIIPDENQPRTEFDQKSIESLADSIKEVGLKTPISVRYDGEKEIYVINHGERRYRAFKLLGLDSIPAIIDNDYDEYAQIIENIQREDLSASDISGFINRKIEQGEKKKDIAKRLGKSPAYVSQYSSFGKMKENLRNAYDNGVCKDVTMLVEINKLYNNYVMYEEIIDKWISEQKSIHRSDIQELTLLLREINQNESNGDMVTTLINSINRDHTGTDELNDNNETDELNDHTGTDEFSDNNETDELNDHTGTDEFSDNNETDELNDHTGTNELSDNIVAVKVIVDKVETHIIEIIENNKRSSKLIKELEQRINILFSKYN